MLIPEIVQSKPEETIVHRVVATTIAAPAVEQSVPRIVKKSPLMPMRLKLHNPTPNTTANAGNGAKTARKTAPGPQIVRQIAYRLVDSARIPQSRLAVTQGTLLES